MAARLDLQLGFTWESPSPAQVATISDCFTPQAGCLGGKTQVGADLGLHHPRNPRACAHSGQLQITSKHHHPAPAQLILNRGQRVVASGHSQSLQLTGLDKSFPLTCQQQPRLNYKKRVYSATRRTQSLGQLQEVQHSVARRRRERARNWKSI